MADEHQGSEHTSEAHNAEEAQAKDEAQKEEVKHEDKPEHDKESHATESHTHEESTITADAVGTVRDLTESAEEKIYDVTRTAVEDAEHAQLESKKLDDITQGENISDPKVQLSASEYGMLAKMNPPLEQRIIGRNEYYLLPEHRVEELPKFKVFDPDTQTNKYTDALKDEIMRLYGKCFYKKRKRGGGLESDVLFIAIPRITMNTPQPFAHTDKNVKLGITHDDIWKENLALETERLGL